MATEGPLCLAARAWCFARGRPFTTAYHTQVPDYVSARTGIPAEWVRRCIRWFHAPAAAILASTPSIRATLTAHGLSHVRHWGRGADLAAFHPGVGAMDDEPGTAIAAALTRDRGACADYARGFTWAASANQFLDALVPATLARAA